MDSAEERTDAEAWQYQGADEENGRSGAPRGAPAERLGWQAACPPGRAWRRRRWVRKRRRRAEAGGVVLTVVLLCSLLRGAKLQECKTRAVALLAQAAALCDDDVRLQRVVPYLLVGAHLSTHRLCFVSCSSPFSIQNTLGTGIRVSVDSKLLVEPAATRGFADANCSICKLFPCCLSN